jgi:hypothetical protein
VHPLLTLALYLLPFLMIAVAARVWMRRKGVGMAEVRAEGDPNRGGRTRFLLGSWRRE